MLINAGARYHIHLTHYKYKGYLQGSHISGTLDLNMWIMIKFSFSVWPRHSLKLFCLSGSLVNCQFFFFLVEIFVSLSSFSFLSISIYLFIHIFTDFLPILKILIFLPFHHFGVLNHCMFPVLQFLLRLLTFTGGKYCRKCVPRELLV